jgi:hypothetical protein
MSAVTEVKPERLTLDFCREGYYLGKLGMLLSQNFLPT